MDSNNIKRLPAFIGGMFAIITGICFIVFPEVITNVIGILFGLVLFVAGLAQVISYIITIKSYREENYGKAAGAEVMLVYSVILMVMGFVLILKHEFFIMLLPTIVGIFFVIDGIVKFRQQLFVFKLKDVHSWVMVILSLLLVAAGIILLADPFAGTAYVIIFTGVAFIVSGLENCFIGVIRSVEKITRKK